MSDCFIWEEDEHGDKKRLVIAIQDHRDRKRKDDSGNDLDAQSFDIWTTEKQT